MTYPISVRKWSADHDGGTKSYHLVLIETADNKALVIKRFGKKSAWGSTQVEKFGDVGLALREFNKTRNSKESRGYRGARSPNPVDAHDLIAFKGAIGTQYWTCLGKENVEFIIPGADTTGVKDPEELKFEKRADGSFKKVERPPLAVEEKPAPEPTIEDRRRAMPNWGMF